MLQYNLINILIHNCKSELTNTEARVHGAPLKPHNIILVIIKILSFFCHL